MSYSPEGAALALFQSGRLGEAEAAWRSILARKPDDPEALHLLGLILARTGRSAEGLSLIDRSIERVPRNAAFLNNRALILSEAGRLVDAERDLRRALQLDSRFVAGFTHLGSILRRTNRLEESTAAFRRALAIDPRSAEAHVGLGNVLKERGDIAAARASYEAALAIDAGNASAHYNLGNLHLAACDLVRAESAFRATLAREPRHAMALTNLGVVLRQTGHAPQALEAIEGALRIEPRNAEALTNRGMALQDLGRTGEAIASFAAAVEARPGFAAALNNWGNALKDGGDLDGAAALFDRALVADPDFADALNNRGNIALEAGDLNEAKRLYARAVAVRPGFVDPRFSLAQIALREHDFAAGWDDYELRFDTSPPMATRRASALARYERADFGSEAHVAVWREQGVGDQLLFSTLLPELAASGARPVVEIDERLLALYRRGLPQVEFVGPGDSERAFSSCVRQLPLGSLPRLFRRDAASFAAQPRAVLRADPDRVQRFRAALGPGRWIGVSWRSFQPRGRRYIENRKSMPIDGLARLASVPGVRLLDLQYGDVAADRAAFAAMFPGVLARLEDLDTYNDFEGLLAAIEACEAVLTVSNVTAHLAGVAGKRAWVLFPAARPPFHYWAAPPGGRSLWYPSVEVVTAAAASWEPLVEEVARRLAASDSADNGA